VEVGVKPRTELRQPVGLSVLIHHPKVGEPLRLDSRRNCTSAGAQDRLAFGEQWARSAQRTPGSRVTINDDRARAVCS